MLTIPFVDHASIAALMAGKDDRVTSISSYMDRKASGELIEQEGTPDFLSFGSLAIEQFGSGPTVTRQLSPWNSYEESQAVRQATQDIHTSGDPVISLFATSAWRLLIVSRTTTMPSVSAGASIEFDRVETLRVSDAKLYVPHLTRPDSSSPAISVWRAVAPAEDSVATSSFLSMAVRLSRTTSTRSSKGSH